MLAIVLGLLPAVTVLAQDIPADSTERERQARETEQSLERLRADMVELKASLGLGAQQEANAVTTLADAERAVSDHQRTLMEIGERRGGHEAELVAIGERQRRFEADLDNQRAALADLLRLTYARHRQAGASLLLDPEQRPRLARTLGYSRLLQRARLTEIDRFTATLAELAGLAEAERQALAALAETERAAEQEQIALAAAVREREAALDALRLELGDQRQRLAALGRDEAQLASLLERLRDIFADLPADLANVEAFTRQRGQLPWPTDGRVENLTGGSLRISADTGTPVRAVGYGRIAYADWLKGYGLLVIIDHGDGYMSLYGHNDALLKGEGHWVQAGEIIAQVGRSGGEATPALLFELRERGRTIDARPWLQRR